MPIRIRTVTLPFKTPDGSDAGASFTIREELPHGAVMEYFEAAASLQLDPESGEVQAQARELHLQPMIEILLRAGLVRLEGVEDENGQPLPVDRFLEFDTSYVKQVIEELQRRALAQPDPNSAAPSVA